MPLRRPSAAAFLTVAVAVVLLCGLGVWQMQRLAWKTALIQNLEQVRRNNPALSYADLMDAAARHAYFLHGHVTGRFMPLQSILVGPRTHDGVVGFHLYTPLILSDAGASAHEAVLVNRGWVPPDFKDDAQGETVTVTGLARLPDRANWFTPTNQPDQRRWFSVDLGAAGRLAGLQFAPLAFYAEAPGPAGAASAPPYPLDADWLPPNNHLQYAIFWFAMAIMLNLMALSRLRGDAGTSAGNLVDARPDGTPLP